MKHDFPRLSARAGRMTAENNENDLVERQTSQRVRRVAAINPDPRAIPKIDPQFGFIWLLAQKGPAVRFQHFPSDVFSSGVCRGDVGKPSCRLRPWMGYGPHDQIADGGDSLATWPMRYEDTVPLPS